jgi:glycerol-3-phosphate acyltransferase PlsY
VHREFHISGGPEAAIGILGVLLGLLVVAVVLALIVLLIIAWWKIFSKAGYPGPLALLMLVPLGEPILVLVLGFSRWPILREMENLKRMQNQPRP